MMGPGDALRDPIFQTFAGIVSMTLILTAVILFVTRVVKGKSIDPVWVTFRSWLVMIPLVMGAVAGGRVAVIVGIGLLSLGGFKEFARATGLYRNWWMTGGVYAGIVCMITVCLVHDPRKETAGWYGLFMTLPVYVVGFLLVIPVLRNRCTQQLQAVALAILGFIYLGWMFGHLAFLANAKHATGYLLFLVFAVEVNDIAAFACGKLFGRHPMRNEISPNKTWEGSIGACCVSLILPWVCWFAFPHFGPMHLVLTGIIVGIGGQLGDLSISVIKRDLGIKDMGVIIPGHGGILDRVDSLIFVSPIFLHMVRWFYDLY